MEELQLANYLRTHRKKAGLSQIEIARLLGYENQGAVCHHERFQSMPSLLTALSYEIVFQAPISELFAGLRDSAEQLVEDRISQLASELEQRSGKASEPQSSRGSLSGCTDASTQPAILQPFHEAHLGSRYSA